LLAVDKRYRSSIPPGAKEVVVTEYRRDALPSGRGCSITMRKTECWYRGKVVGWRFYEEDGSLSHEVPLKGDLKHGIEYSWHERDCLATAEPHSEGLQHGTARQWTADGRLLGTYTLRHGTGLDVWRGEREDGTVYIAEIHGLRDGSRHGFTWFFWDAGMALWSEEHFQDGYEHGVFRHWNPRGGLRRGYPKYYVRGKRVVKRAYLRAAKADPTLPPFRAEDQQPVRTFPPELRRKLGLGSR
jgi:hypothetical protein